MNKQVIEKVSKYLTLRNVKHYTDELEVIVIVNELHLTLSQGECVNLAIVQTESELEYLNTL